MIIVKPGIEAIPNFLSLVARNHGRILNHRKLIQKKIVTAQLLGLIKSRFYSEETVENNNRLLASLHNNDIDLHEMVNRLYECRSDFFSLKPKKINLYLENLVSAGHIELHPTDVCDHECVGCFYKDEGSSVLPFEYIRKILKIYNPRSVVLVGGGEPTLYKYKKFRFPDIVNEIKHIKPGIQIGLVTKGTYIPPGEWQNLVDWVRLSLDSASPEIFYLSKKKDAFKQVLDNYYKYLQGPIRQVDLGFLYWSANIHETYKLPGIIYNTVNSKFPGLISKTHIQYRPLRPSVNVPEKIRKGHISDDMICSVEQVENAVRHFERIIEREPAVGSFILEHTNWHKVAEGNGIREGKPFSSCYYSFAFKLFRPTGEVYPCFVRVSDPEYLLGNYIKASKDEHIKINLLSIFMFNRRRLFCEHDKCRIAWLNNIAEKGLNNGNIYLTESAVKSYFF